MTIVGGFQCSDGVLLCADSEISQGNAKYSESKLYKLSDPKDGAWCWCVYSGETGFMKQVLADLERAARSGEHRIIGELQETCVSINLLSRERMMQGSDNPWLYLLFAILVPTIDPQPKIYSAIADTFYLVKDWEFQGIGRDAARAFVSPVLKGTKKPLSLWQASFLAAYALKQAKDSVQGCGQETEIIWLKPEDVLFHPLQSEQDEILQIEKDFVFLRNQLGRILLSFSGCLQFDDEMKRLKDYRKMRVREEKLKERKKEKLREKEWEEESN